MFIATQLQAAAEVPPVGGFNPMMLILMLAMLGMLFWMQSRAKKQAAQRDAFRSQLTVGQRVMTQGGLVGTIVGINDATDTIILDSAGSRCEYMRAGIAKTLDAVPGEALPAPVAEVPAGAVITPAPQYGANVTAAAPAPAAGGFLANALGNLGAVNTGPEVTDADFAELDAIADAHRNSLGNDVAASGPIIVTEDDE